MPRYRKKPLEIVAHQWFKNGDHPNDDCEIFSHSETGEPFLGEGKVVRRYRIPVNLHVPNCVVCGEPNHDHGFIDTLEGGHRVCPGDYIITGIVGEYYPCKPAIFEDSYELIEEI